MTKLIYNVLLHLYFFVTLPFYIFKLFTTEKYRRGLKQRLGFVPSSGQLPCILIHTVSVGEFLAALPLIKRIENEFDTHEVVVSTTTLTGNRLAKRMLGQENRVVYFPLDFSWAVGRFLRRIVPQLVILIETELWPNFLQAAQNRNMPVVVVNGRISRKSFKNYFRFHKLFLFFCQPIAKWGMQSEVDHERIITLGISREKAIITGSLKFDSALERLPRKGEIDKIKHDWGWQEHRQVLVAGSTHRGEEKILLDIYKELQDNFKELVLVIAPRHPERRKELELLFREYGFAYSLRSAWDKDSCLLPGKIVLVDTLGELLSIYSLASIVFIGKSLVKGGGQNLLEPAALGKAVICGPYMDNFSAVTRWLVNNEAIVQIEDSASLQDIIADLLRNPAKCTKLGGQAQKLIINAAGAVDRNAALIKSAMT